MFFTNNLPDKIYLVNNDRVLQHRYVSHPNYHYRFFQIIVKGENKGILIATEVLRSSGISSFVVSDWLFSDQEIEKRRSLFISKLHPHNRHCETISFWEYGQTFNITDIFLGILRRKRVSLISIDFRIIGADKSAEFGDFRMGWSDNG